MRIVSNIDEVQRKFNQAERAIQRANVATVKGAVRAGQRYARSIAPSASGALKEGIITKPVVRKGKVVSSALISKVPGDFPYQKWVNENIKTVNLPRRRTRYGTWPRASTRRKWEKIGLMRRWKYRETKHSGVPRYFDLTFERMKQMMPELALREMKTQLKIALT